MPAFRFASMRPALSTCALAAAIGLPIACAQGSTETDLGGGLGGAGGARATSTTTTPTTGTGNTGGQASTSSSTSGFPTSSTSGFPSSSSSSTSGFPSSSSSSTSGSTTTSTTSTTTPTTTTTTVTSSGGSACDNKGDCGTCVSCADQTVCLAAGNACFADLFCGDVFNCAITCPDASCIDFCIFLYGDPLSEQLFVDYYNCLGCSCEIDCQVTGCP